MLKRVKPMCLALYFNYIATCKNIKNMLNYKYRSYDIKKEEETAWDFLIN